jgi:hypothetical protein
MRGRKSPLQQQEAIRLWVEERLTLREIQARTRVPKSSLSAWLKPYPLTAEERREKHRVKAHPRGPRKARGDESKHQRAIGERRLTRQDKARIAESAILFRLALHGFGVYRAPFDGDKADWLVETAAGSKYKLQVKWASTAKHGLPYFALRCTGEGHAGKKAYRRYVEGEWDFIVGYDLFTDTAYVFSFDEIADHKTIITVRPDAAERWDKLM